jgi:hypothetical protein
MASLQYLWRECLLRQTRGGELYDQLEIDGDRAAGCWLAHVDVQPLVLAFESEVVGVFDPLPAKGREGREIEGGNFGCAT